MKKRVRIALIVLLLVLVTSAAVGWLVWRSIYAPNTAFKEEDRILLIPHGAGFEQVMDSLRSLDVLEQEQAFRWVAQKKKYDGHVRPGRFRIAPGMSNNDLVNKLRAGEQDPVRVTFTNIKSLPQLAGQVARYVETDSASMLAAFTDPATVHDLGFTPETMIALFIPNTYEVWWTETPTAFTKRMAREYEHFWTEDRRDRASAKGLSPGEVSTLASIVQAETARADEAPSIAGVYLNRLRIGMPLQADPTLKFALGLDSLSRVLDGDKAVDSPYNTYKYAGLPPGPINMPEPRYLDAVLHATSHDYYYFCAREDLSGYSNFARSYEQHLVNARRYQRALNERGIYR